MDVEQTLKVLEFGRDLSMKAAGIWRGCSAATAAEYLNQADACSHAIAIIKAAQEFKQAHEDALDASDANFEQAVARAEEKRDVLFSLLSPEQAQKKEG